MQLFWEKGYGSTSVADVLQAARVNSGSLYHFFPGKQDLLLAVLDMYHGGLRTMLLEPAWRGVTDPIERIFALLARYRRSLADTDCFYGCPIGSLALELHEPDQPVRERLAANFAAWTDAIHQCLKDAGSRLPSDLDRRELAAFVLTAMEGGVMQARTFRDIGAHCTVEAVSCVPTLRPCCARRGPGGPRAREPCTRRRSDHEPNDA